MTDDVLYRTARQPDFVVRYGGGVLQIADVYLPAVSSLGRVILLHGGFWRNRYDRTHLRPLAEALASDGYTVALPEYRRIGDEGGGHPGTFDDIERAVAVLPGLLDAVGAADVHDARTTLVGHSAGGQLALWSQAARAADERASAPVDRVISLAGVLDLAEAHRLGLSGDAVGELLDERTAGFADRLAAVDPMQLAVPPSSRVRTVVFHGAEDSEVPVEFSRAYARRSAHIVYRELASAGHYDVIDPVSAAYPIVLAALSVA